ncbi:MAG: hypothetical protein LBP50_09425 [Tannerella sp.]|jgi:hypothetical protein|nr:hypothetical protein [Tannerella sp.]
MKKKALLLNVIFVMLCRGTASCTQMYDDMDRPAGKKTGYVHTVRKDGVEFKLCLLNEQGEPAAVFREGENFSFRFEMENLREGDGRQYIAHLMGGLFGSGFCNVFTPDRDSVHAVFQRGARCVFVLGTDPFDGENRLSVTIPLHDDEEEWHHGTCDYFRNPPAVLPKGNYSTGFTYTFEYRIPPPGNTDINSTPPSTWVEVGPVTMKIDFTIE